MPQFTPVQSFIFMLLDLISNIAMLILLIRFVAAPYLYFDSGPIIQSINQAAMVMSSPFRRIAFWLGFRKRDISPLIAIAVILILRGVLYTLLPASFSGVSPDSRAFLEGQQLSFFRGCRSLLRVTAFVLFASVMFARAGGFFSGAFFRSVDNIASGLFRFVRKIVFMRNLWGLLVVSYILIALVFAVVACLILWDIRLWAFWIVGLLTIASLIIWVMIILILAYIIVSWLLAFQLVEPGGGRWWMGLQALVRPPLDRTRRMFPWMRIGMLDLSPMVLFLFLYLCQALIASAYGFLPTL